MSDGTKIEWTHRPGTIPATMNALVGCQKVSEGCRNCYAIRQSHRFSGQRGKFFGTTLTQGGKPVWSGTVNLDEDALLAPLRKKKPHTYFVNSMSDLFYEGVPDEWIDRHFAVFALCPQHTFIVLTKRPERMREYVLSTKARMAYGPPPVIGRQSAIRDCVHRFAPDSLERDKAIGAVSGTWEAGCGPLPNVWLGVSVEDQKTADERIPLLLQTPAAVRFISAEPLLGKIKLRAVHGDEFDLDFLSGEVVESDPCTEHDRFPYGAKLDWVICGGESGAGARPMQPAWARSLRDQCVAAGVPFFFKQWGEWEPFRHSELESFLAGHPGMSMSTPTCMVKSDGTVIRPFCAADGPGATLCRVGKKAAGRMLDGRTWDEFPETK